MTSIIDPYAALILLILLGIIVVILNTFALAVLLNTSKRKRVSKIALIWILIANILIGLFPLPIYGLKKYEFKSITISGRICDAWRYTYFLCIHLALVSLLIMTFEKIYILVFSFRHKRMLNGFRLNIIFAGTWIFFIFFDMIPFFPVSEHDNEMCYYYIKKDWALAMNIMTMAIPLPLVTCCYVYMVYLAYKQTVQIEKQSSTADNKRGKIRLAFEVKATRKVALIVGAYILCWTPATLYYLLIWLCPDCYPKNYQPHKTWMKFFFKLLNLFHAFLTPIIFCCRNKEFQKDARRFLRRMKKEDFESRAVSQNYNSTIWNENANNE